MTVMNKELDKAKQEEQPKQQKEIIDTKLVITMVIISIVKIAVLILWIQFRNYTLVTKFNNIKKLDWRGAAN
jgi:uncharacterized membrane protein